eukprot:30177-Pelagococcus_subviridis.AAC.1
MRTELTRNALRCHHTPGSFTNPRAFFPAPASINACDFSPGQNSPLGFLHHPTAFSSIHFAAPMAALSPCGVKRS